MLRDRLVVPFFSLALLLLPCAHGQTAAGNGRWVSTWSTSLQALDLNYGETNAGFSNITLRQIVHTSLGGHRVRLRLSNAYNTQSVRIGETHIALRARDASIIPGSDRRLTFSGRTGITMPPNAPVVSDPVDLDVPPLSDVSISIYLPDATGPAPWHVIALETSFLSPPGNFTSTLNINSPVTTDSWFYIHSLEVEANGKPSLVAALGDSITDGATSTSDANRRWPDYLARRLHASGDAIAVVDAGISGNRLLHNGYGENAEGRFESDVLAQPGLTHIVILEGINDIFSLLGDPKEVVSATQIIGALKQLAIRAHERGIKVIGATITPAGLASSDEAKRQAVNTWIRCTQDLDGYADFDLALRDPKHPSSLAPAYDSGDGLHPGDNGYRKMAETLDLNLLR